MLFHLLPDHLYHFLTSSQLARPLLPHLPYLAAEFVVLEPNNQLSHLPAFYLLHKVSENEFHHFALVFNGLEHPIELLGECFEDFSLLRKSIFVLVDQLRHLSYIHIQYFHNL
jgi:hypothetical protein